MYIIRLYRSQDIQIAEANNVTFFWNIFIYKFDYRTLD